MQEQFIVCSTRPDLNDSTYLGQEGFIQATDLASAQQYLAEKRLDKRDPSSIRLYRLVEVQ
jgi:hypothetical protein